MERDWKSIVQFYVQDPSDLNDRRSPRTKKVLTVVLDRDFNEVINDHSEPMSVVLDAAIVHVTADEFVAHEFQADGGGHIEFNCAVCAHGLSLWGCPGCGHRFQDDGYRSGWDTPLSRKMVAFLREHGHVFRVDPELAWAKERENWERNVEMQHLRR